MICDLIDLIQLKGLNIFIEVLISNISFYSLCDWCPLGSELHPYSVVPVYKILLENIKKQQWIIKL